MGAPRDVRAWRSEIADVCRSRQDLQVYSNLADKLEGMAKAAALAFDDVQKLVRASLPTVFESQDLRKHTYATHCRVGSRSGETIFITVNDWVAARNAIIQLRSEGLGVIADGLINKTILPNEARSIYRTSNSRIALAAGNSGKSRAFDPRRQHSYRMRIGISRFRSAENKGGSSGGGGAISRSTPKRLRWRNGCD